MRVTLEMDQNGNKEQHTSKIMEFDRNYLYLTYPSHQRKGTTTYVADGQLADISVVGSNNVVYKFSSEILGRKKIKKIPVLYIRIPHSTEIKKIQRRQYVRVDNVLDVAVYSLEEEKAPLITRSVDISGGGLAVVTDSQDRFKPDETVRLMIVLPFSSDKYEYIESPGKVVRNFLDQKHAEPRMSINFTDIQPNNREKIIKFIFEKQLEERRKLSNNQNSRRKRI
nr:flagellar brake domain-containing protein [Allobacillus saliphilus]